MREELQIMGTVASMKTAADILEDIADAFELEALRIADQVGELSKADEVRCARCLAQAQNNRQRAIFLRVAARRSHRLGFDFATSPHTAQ